MRIVAGTAINPVWSADGNLIVYAGAGAAAYSQLLAVRRDGAPVQLPAIQTRRGDGERARFLPGGKALVYMQGLHPSQDFWLLDLSTYKTRQLTRLDNLAAMRSFDITPRRKADCVRPPEGQLGYRLHRAARKSQIGLLGGFGNRSEDVLSPRSSLGKHPKLTSSHLC
jgi:hypothetical protein